MMRSLRVDALRSHAFAAPVLLAATTLASGQSAPDAVPVEKEPMHRLVFHNDVVDVLDILIPPGATTRWHVHAHDLAGLTISSAPTREEADGKPPSEEPAYPEDEAWFEAFPAIETHRVTNTGGRSVRYIAFQLLKPAGGSDQPTLPQAHCGKVVVDNPRVRIVRIDLDPGESAADHAHANDFAVVLGAGGRIEQAGTGERQRNDAGFIGWNRADTHHRLRNTGDKPIEVLEFEFRR